MAPIRRAKSYLVYIVALAVSAVFSLFGRSAPVWAGDATADRSAKVFREMYQVAGATTDMLKMDGHAKNATTTGQGEISTIRRSVEPVFRVALPRITQMV